MEKKFGLGCGKRVNMNTSIGFICGVANAWGEERFCKDCKKRLKIRWKSERKEKKMLNKFIYFFINIFIGGNIYNKQKKILKEEK